MNKYALLLVIAFLFFNLQAQSTSEKTFTAQVDNAKSNFSQKLSAKWIAENTVIYTFAYNNGSCTKNITGKAILKKIKKDGTLTLNASETEYFSSNKYIDKGKKGFDVILHISDTDKDKAVVEFITKDDYDLNYECNPAENIMAAN